MIDNHCHPFALEPVPFDPTMLSLDVEEGDRAEERRRALGPGRVSQALLMAKLATRLGCEPEEVIQARDRAASDWPRYVSSLFADAGITDLVMDVAWPLDARDHLDEYAALSGCRLHPILRIEPVIDRAISDGAGASEIVRAVVDEMARAVTAGFVGFKTIVAYRTGLSVDPDVSIAEADRSLREAVPVRRRAKALRDLVLRQVLAAAIDLKRPVQIHTGIGDSELRLAESNPLLLEELLRTQEGSEARVVLIHGSFPWHDELAYLAATKPNVWADMSLFMLFSPVTAATSLLRVVDLAPTARILAGTDAYLQPELFWFGGLLLTDAWQAVAKRLDAAGVPRGWTAKAQAAFFEGNARELYGI